MGLKVKLLVTVDPKADPRTFVGTAAVKGTGHSAIRLSDRKLIPVAASLALGGVTAAHLPVDLETQMGWKPVDVAGDTRKAGYVTNIADEEAFVLATDVTFTPLPAAPVPAPVTVAKVQTFDAAGKVINEFRPI